MTTADPRPKRNSPGGNSAPDSSGQAENSTAMLVDSAAVPGDGERAGDAAPAQDAGGASKEPSSSMDDLLVDEKMLKEEEAAREERKTADRPRAGGGLTHERLQKLDVLLDQAQMYSKFLTEQVETIQKEIEVPDEPSPEKKGGKRKAKGGSTSKSKRSRGVVLTPTAAMLPLIDGELRNYQLKGITWLISLWTNGMNGILADQMGLGKTVQTIGFLSHLRQNHINGPFLIVVPLSTLPNWKKEVTRWCPSMHAIVYHGDKTERLEMERTWLKPSHGVKCPVEMPVVITTYEIAMRDRKALSRVNFKYMVIDEGHRLKNSNCRLVRELKLIPAENKLLLTGTPLQNNLAELWSLLNFLLPAVFNNLEDFESWFDFSHVVSSNAGESEHASRDILEAEAKNRMVSKLHDILKPFLLRRVKADVETSLPPKREIVLYAPLTATQLEIEKKLVDKTLISEIQAQQKRGGRNIDMGKLNNILMQLRKNCNHPDLITSEWEESAVFPAADVLVQQCGKMQVLDRLLTRLHAAGHKVLIFSQFTRMMDVLDAYLEDRGHQVARIDGTMSYQKRMGHIDNFNDNADCFAFLLSTRAGGLGLNLTSADTVIIYDSDWNPHQDMQAMDRAHRIGQTKPVLVLRLCTSNSVEVKLLQRATSKLALERLVIKKGAFVGDTAAAPPDKGVSLNAQDLLDVLQNNIRLEGKQQNEMVSDEMMETLLDRSHLYTATSPYGESGLGYEVVAQQSSGLLSSVQ